VADVSAGGSAQPASDGDRPPKPNLTLRVGISGHRPKDTTFPAGAVDRVRRQLRDVFDAIDRTLEELKHANKEFYAQDGAAAVPHKVRLVSGLAEGADQLAVDARPSTWELDAVLPFPEAYYLPDFKTSARDGKDVTAGFIAARDKATTLVQLPRDPRLSLEEPTAKKENDEYWRLRNQAYARLGRFLLGQTDVLVVIWDGKREEGPGGTAEVVRGALDAGIPVVWISTAEDIYPRMVAEADENGHAVAPDADALQGPLRSVLSTIVSVPTVAPEPGHGKHNPSAEQRLRDFFAETWPKPTYSVIYDLFKRFVEGKKLRRVIKPPTPQEAQSQLEPFIAATPAQAGALRERVRRFLAPRYAWADQLAIERSNWYRSAYINCYLLAALLVAVALFGVFVHDIFEHNDRAMLAYKAALVVFELLLIWLIFRIVRRGRRFRWQERWVEYRALAEMFRSVPFLAYLGEHGYIQRSHDFEPASSAWFLWYLRATIREIGLPSAVLNGTYQNDLLIAVEKHVIDDQLGYNKGTATALARMHRLLHVFGDFCFILTGILLGVFFAAYIVYLAGEFCAGKSIADLIGWHHGSPALGTIELCGASPWSEKLGHVLFVSKSSVTFFAALLPALGAAVFGIRETGDFEGFAKRAARTAEKLGELKHDVAKARRKLALDSTTGTLLATAQVLSEDVGAWQSVYGRKQLNLPG
jgi:hypothetical protein